jgi:hypothetical protein
LQYNISFEVIMADGEEKVPEAPAEGKAKETSEQVGRWC